MHDGLYIVAMLVLVQLVIDIRSMHDSGCVPFGSLLLLLHSPPLHMILRMRRTTR